MTSLPSYEIKLDKGKPFPPLAQLLSVLPPQSAQLKPLFFLDYHPDPFSDPLNLNKF